MKVRLKGSRAKGKTYEKKIIKTLTPQGLELGYEVHSAQWLAFMDANGRGFAQPDLFMEGPKHILLFEAKLTQSDSAEAQCLKLYKPLLEKIYPGKVVISCQVFKNIRYTTSNYVEGLKDLLTKTEGYWLWHNLGE